MELDSSSSDSSSVQLLLFLLREEGGISDGVNEALVGGERKIKGGEETGFLVLRLPLFVEAGGLEGG